MYSKIYYTLIGVIIFSACTFAQEKLTGPLTNLFKAPTLVLIIAGVLLLSWIALVMAYLIWSIHRYNINLGLSNHEWKILYPEAYAGINEKQKYLKIKEELLADAQRKKEMQSDVNGENRVDITAPFMEPDQNPYERDSFGLPPNTIRGIIALTAVFLFVLVEGVNFFSTARTETDFSDLILVLQMVIAFYFGSRAFEVFKDREKEKKEETVIKEKPAIIPAEIPSVSTPEKPLIRETTEAEKLEKPLLPEEKNVHRIISSNENLSTVQPEVQASGADDIRSKPLPERILALTGSFETSQGFPKCFAGMTGNFDGQGISLGVLQWNFGQGSLPPLLQKMNTLHNDVCKNILGSLYFDFDRMLKMSRSEQLAWSKSIQFTQIKNGKVRWSIDPKWSMAFINLAMTNEMIRLQAEAAGIVYHKALGLCNEYELITERGAALLFDIVTQNGSVDKNGSGRRIKEEYLKIPSSLDQNQIQIEKMIVIANKRAEVSNPAFVEDVRSRKLAIAKGEGKVHSKMYNLDKEFNITLKSISNV